MPENSEKPPDLDNLPLKVAKLIVKPLDYASRNSLRLTTKSLKTAVDESEVTYEMLTLKLADHGKAIGIQLITDKHSYTTLKRKFVAKPSEPLKFIEAAVDRVMKVLKNPNLHLRLLVIDSKSRTATSRIVDLSVPSAVHLQFNKAMEHLLTLLCSKLLNLPSKLSVYHFKMEFDWRQEEVFKLLSILQPVTLKKISLISSFLVIDTDKIVELEQWKRAEELEWICETGMDLEHWKHFRRVDIHWERPTKQQMDAVFEHFLFTTDWEHVFITFPEAKKYLEIYFKTFNLDGVSVSADKRDLFDYTRYRSDKESWTIQGQTCRFFNNIVRSTGSTYEKLTLTLADNRSAIFIELFVNAENRLELEFEQDPLGYTVRNPQKGWEKTVVYNQYRHELKPQFDFIGGAMNHFLKIFTKNTVVKKLCLVTMEPWNVFHFLNRVLPTGTLPAARLENMSPYAKSFASNQKELTRTLLHLLSKKQHLLKVEQIEVHQSFFCFAIARVIKFLDPMVLQRISINGELSEKEYEEIASCEAWKRAKEFYSSRRLSPALWAHFPKSEVFCTVVSGEQIEAIFNALFASSTWENVLVKSTTSIILEERFLNRLEDQRPIGSRIVNSKLIKIPNTPNQFINYQLIGQRNISFNRVIQ